MWTTNILTAGKTLPGLQTYLLLKSVPHADTICSAARSKQHTINRSGITSQAPSPCLLAAAWIIPRSNVVPGFKTWVLELTWYQKEQSLLGLVCQLTILTQAENCTWLFFFFLAFICICPPCVSPGSLFPHYQDVVSLTVKEKRYKTSFAA